MDAWPARDYACPFRTTCFNVQHLINQMMYFSSKCYGSYATVYAFRDFIETPNDKKRKIKPDYSKPIIKCAYSDFDSHNSGKTVRPIYDTYVDARKLKEIFQNACTTIFTSRGVHAYIWFNQCITKQRLKDFQRTIKTKLDLKSMDELYGDTARVLRVPWSIHNKSGALILPYNPLKQTFDEITAISESVKDVDVKYPKPNIDNLHYTPVSLEIAHELIK